MRLKPQLFGKHYCGLIPKKLIRKKNYKEPTENKWISISESSLYKFKGKTNAVFLVFLMQGIHMSLKMNKLTNRKLVSEAKNRDIFQIRCTQNTNSKLI